MSPRDWKPGELLEASGAYWSSCALHAAVKLELFTRLAEDRLTAAEIAGRVHGEVRGVEPLLNAMAAFGLLVKTDGTYANSACARSLLCQASPAYIGRYAHAPPSPGGVLVAAGPGGAGRPAGARTVIGERRAVAREFSHGHVHHGHGRGPPAGSRYRPLSRHRLLDLGGRPGTYAIHFCLAHPQLTADVFDLPTSRPFAEQTIARFDLGGRVAFRAGDYHTDEITGTYDAAWLSHILHVEGPEECVKIIRKAVSALSPGGVVMIHEFILNDAMDGPVFPALFALNMLLGTPAGQAYSERQLMDMLAAGGGRDLRRIPVQTPNDSGVIVGIV